MAQSRQIIGRRRDVLLHSDGRRYLSRWFLFDKDKRPHTPRLHLFHSSDEPTPHDHPSDFLAMALFGWAREHLYERVPGGGLKETRRRLVLPFVPRYTPAETIHRIVSPRRLVTVVAFRRYHRQWGFWPIVEGVRRWLPHTEFRRENGGGAAATM